MAEEVLTATKENSQIEVLREFYKSNPAVSLLIQILSAFSFGIVGGVDAAIRTHVSNIQKERLKTFFDEIGEGIIDLTESDIQREEFLHAFISTTRATQNTRNREKIKLFGKLFSKFIKDKDFENADEYEEWLAILNDLSYREFQLLLLLKNKAPAHPLSLEKLQEFYRLIENELNIKVDEIEGWLFRIERTGLCANNGGFDGGVFEIRPNFDSFLKALGINSNPDIR